MAKRILVLTAVTALCWAQSWGQTPEGSHAEQPRVKQTDQPEIQGTPTPEEIIRRFAEKEREFRKVWQQYTYQQRIVFQVIGPSNRVQEEREMLVEVYFTNDGKRQTRKLSDKGRLRSVGITKEDISDAISMQPFVLTTEDLPSYDIRYKGKKAVDELHTYVFEVEPKRIESGKRYFSGQVWVDDIDLQIVMTRGKILPESRENKYPRFETVREQIDGEYWFPTWTEADDVLTFGDFYSGYRSVHVRQLITFSDFKKFEVDTSIRYDPIPQ